MASHLWLLRFLNLISYTHAAPLRSLNRPSHAVETDILSSRNIEIKARSLFQGQGQVDAVTVLMLLGEATIWKTIWGRFRSKRSHWRQWAFAISPGWTPLAASLFAAMNGSLGPPNLVFDRPPEGSLTSGLTLTNLDSGASHIASNTVLQNIWHTWNRGPRKKKQWRAESRDLPFNVTREVGVVDVDLDALLIEDTKSVWLHIGCLATQLTISLVCGLTGYSFETLLILLLALTGQMLLLFSITPRHEAWHKVTRGHRPHPVILHENTDSMGVLFIRKATLHGQDVSLEEYCWDSQALRSSTDYLKLVTAGTAFLVFVAQIILVSWMSSQSRIFYLILGGLGLLANTLEAASQPRWMRAFQSAFTGSPHCAPLKGSLMCAVAILVAGEFPAARDAAGLLYPNNARFQQSLRDLKDMSDRILCTECRKAIRVSEDPARICGCVRQQAGGEGNDCASLLASVTEEIVSKQLRDGLATLSHLLRDVKSRSFLPAIDTTTPVTGQKLHTWQMAEFS
ncbi:hypothetical protein MMC28_010981 [Mycoblastus sanguinarius]|nr:hypothetical protein [Mycoblastus sanguinarius]